MRECARGGSRGSRGSVLSNHSDAEAMTIIDTATMVVVDIAVKGAR